MDSSASMISCLHCMESSTSLDHFRNGWRLRNGEFAKLCIRCSSAFEEGRFCEAFHSDEDGWRDCVSCAKMLHCGCIASMLTHQVLDLGGVMCIDCTRISFMQVRNIDAQHTPRYTTSELQEIAKDSETVVIPLFEKQLTKSDADRRLARLVLPKKCAEAYFPSFSDPHGTRIEMYDVEGKAWDFAYRYWVNNGTKMYILEGLKEFMVEKGWEAGDTVSFYKLDPTGSFVIGLKKKAPNQQASQASTS